MDITTTRGAQAVLARLRGGLQRWWGRAVASGVRGSAPRDGVALVLLLDTRLLPAAGSPGIVEVIREHDRSPPGMRPLCPYPPVIAARAPPGDTLGTGGGWHRASASARTTKPLSQRASQAASGQRAA